MDWSSIKIIIRFLSCTVIQEENKLILPIYIWKMQTELFGELEVISLLNYYSHTHLIVT